MKEKWNCVHGEEGRGGEEGGGQMGESNYDSCKHYTRQQQTSWLESYFHRLYKSSTVAAKMCVQ
jgi:hypothetical protein